MPESDQTKQNKPATRSVLVIDDDPIILEVARERLANAGFEVTVRGDVLGTTRWLAAHPVGYLLLDVMMPALDGSELMALLKQREATRRVAVVLYSSMPVDELAKLAAKSGAAGYISKDVDAQSFVEQFRTIVALNPH